MDLGPVFGFLGVVVGAVLLFLGTRFTARQSAKAAVSAAESAARPNDRQVDVEEWRTIVATLREEIGRLTARVDNLETRRSADEIEIEALKAEGRAKDVLYAVLLAYTRELRTWAARIAAPDNPSPPAPASLAVELE